MSDAKQWKTSRRDLQSYLGDGTPVVYVYRDPEERIAVTGPMCRRDADRIAVAVNAHDDLVAALMGVADFDPDDSGGEGWKREDGWCWCGGSVRHTAACRQARAALAKAEAKP